MADQNEIDLLREEVAYWRRDCIARLAVAVGLHKAMPNEDLRAGIRVGQINPTLAAWRDAEAAEWHPRCESCGEFLKNGQHFFVFEDALGMHANCNDPDSEYAPPGSFRWDDGFGEERIASVLASARGLLDA